MTEYQVREGHTYEVREDHASYYYPFSVYEDGKPLDKHFGLRDGAEIWIGTGGDVMDLVMFNSFSDEDTSYPEMEPGSEDEKLYNKQKAFYDARRASMPAKPVITETPEKSVTFITDHQYRVGELLVDDGHAYLVTEDSYWISARDADGMEEGFDAFTESGWHTPAQLVPEE